MAVLVAVSRAGFRGPRGRVVVSPCILRSCFTHTGRGLTSPAQWRPPSLHSPVRAPRSVDASPVEVEAFVDDPLCDDVDVLGGPHPSADLLLAHADSAPAICPFVTAVRPIVRASPLFSWWHS